MSEQDEFKFQEPLRALAAKNLKIGILNFFFHLGNKNNPTVITIQNKNDILITNFPGHNPKIRFDGSGGIMMNKVNRVEIRGFEIVGPNNGITKSEAMQV